MMTKTIVSDISNTFPQGTIAHIRKHTNIIFAKSYDCICDFKSTTVSFALSGTC